MEENLVKLPPYEVHEVDVAYVQPFFRAHSEKF